MRSGSPRSSRPKRYTRTTFAAAVHCEIVANRTIAARKPGLMTCFQVHGGWKNPSEMRRLSVSSKIPQSCAFCS